jgi:CheY-like chemotaxis protein
MAGYSFDKLKVLIVDDNQHMRALVSTVLRAFGVTAIHDAANTKKAWQEMEIHRPDVIFLDWVFDDESGLDFTHRVRTSPDSPNPFVPIIMLTGYTQLERVRAARDIGVNEFLAKPVLGKGILSRLISVIEYPRPFVRTKAYFGPSRRRRRDDEYDGPERRDLSAVKV